MSEELVQQTSDLANILLNKSETVFVLGKPLRNSQLLRAKEVNFLLASRQEDWRCRGISRQVFSN